MTELRDTEQSQTIDFAARRASRAQARGTDRRRNTVLLVGGLFLALVALAVSAEFALSAGRVHRGVTVAGVDIGGLRPADAAAVLEKALPAKSTQPVVVTYRDKQWRLSADDVGLVFDYRATVDDAMDVGRRGPFMAAAAERLGAWRGRVDLEPSASADDGDLTTALRDVVRTTDVAPVNATVKMDGLTPRVIDGSDGRALDRAEMRELIVAAFTSKDRKVPAKVDVDPMLVTAADAREAAKVAESMLGRAVTVSFGERTWSFPQDDVATWLAFRPIEAASATGTTALDVYVSPKLAQKRVTSALGTKVGRAAKNARFVASDGKVKIIPSQDGIGPDVEALALALTEELKDSSADRVVELRTSRTEPEITTEKAQSMGIRERISTYTTTYESGNRPRVNNIHTLGDALNGALIPPGGVFSFNETAGERTAEKGYQEANAIVNGKLVPQLGGGVCQVGTTVFNAVFESGFPVIERKNHSFYISHYPKGRDATVSWGAPDLKFKNDSEHWVLVAVSYTNGSITVSLYGTDPGYEVEAEVGAWTKERPFGIEKIEDPTMYVGTQSIEDGGITGRSITVKRIVSKGGKVFRTDTFVSNYKPKVQVLRVGTKPKPVVTTPKP